MYSFRLVKNKEKKFLVFIRVLLVIMIIYAFP